MQMNKITYLPARTFLTTERIRLLMQAAIDTILAILFFVLTILVLVHNPTPQYNWKLAAILGIVGLAFLVLGAFSTGASRTYLLLSAEGIELHGFGYKVASPWENVARIDLVPQTAYPFSPASLSRLNLLESPANVINDFSRKVGGIVPETHQEGLVLKKPVPHIHAWWRFRFTEETWFLSLNLFRWWRYSELGKQMRQFAPHLFEER